MRIKKTSETTVIQAEIVNAYNSSTSDGYSCNYINNIKTIMNIGLTDNTSTVTANTAIPFDLQLNSIGSGLTFDSTNHGIKIGANISYINVSATLSIQYSASNTVYGIVIAKNGTDVPKIRANINKTTGEVWTASIPPMLVQVQENDIITAKLISNNAVVRPETILNVEVVK